MRRIRLMDLPSVEMLGLRLPGVKLRVMLLGKEETIDTDSPQPEEDVYIVERAILTHEELPLLFDSATPIVY